MAKTNSNNKSQNQNKLPFQRKNYMIMFIGIAVLITGFVIMTLDSEQYGFGFLGLTLGPIVVMAGFIIQFVAIFSKDKAKDNNE